MGIRDDVAAVDDEAGPDETGIARRAVDLDVLGMAIAGELLDQRIVGQVDGRGRDRLEADEQIGQRRVVEQPRELAGDLGRGGRKPLSARTTNDVWACEARVGLGPAARSPPVSQMTRSAWAAPTKAPRTRSSVPKTPSPSSPRGRPPDGRTDRLADPDAEQDSQQHDERPERRIQQRAASLRGTAGGRSTRPPPGIAPASPTELRQGPGAEPDHHRDEQEDDHDEVEQVHRGSMDEPAPNVGTGSLTARTGRLRDGGQLTVIVTGGVALPPAS